MNSYYIDMDKKQTKATEAIMEYHYNDIITINGVNFSINELTKAFPNSYFSMMFSGNFLESAKTNIKITFPMVIDPLRIHGTRYMNQISYRLSNGLYQYPGINPETADAILPEADGDRFISFREMEQVFDFLMLDKWEKDLVEVVEISESEDEDDDDFSDDYHDILGDDDCYDSHDNFQADYSDEDYKIYQRYPDDFDEMGYSY